ncbi:MAG: xanthine dehydrogenase family protein subunit M [Alphaproteobacteria bacterium]|nr:xanthine dehydrogenase family protein subunit M [Alphaproteobacteria bacterium]
MKPPAFVYHDPSGVDDAVALLARLENARLLAGGQSLMPMLNMRYAMPDHIIDLNRIEALASITQIGETLRIGAMARQRDLADHPLVRTRLPLMIEALGHVGHRQTRNRGTIGGSLCHLDPAAELVAVAANLDATIEIAGPIGVRCLPMAEFPLGFMTPNIAPDEMVTAIHLPLPAPGHGSCFLEMARRHGDFAIVAVAVLLVLDPAGRVASCAVTLGGATAVPLRMAEAEAMLRGATPDRGLFERMAATARGIDAIEDAQVPAWYRRQIAETLIKRALPTAHARAAGERRAVP